MQGDRAERRGALAASLKASLLVRHILEETVEVPNAFKCPITLTVMREPAVTHEGTLAVGTSCACADM